MTTSTVNDVRMHLQNEIGMAGQSRFHLLQDAWRILLDFLTKR